jgi:restriction system protein
MPARHKVNQRLREIAIRVRQDPRSAARPAIFLAVIGWFILLLVRPGFFIPWSIVGVAIAGFVARAKAKAKRQREADALRLVRSTEIARYHAMGPGAFEDAIAYLCHRDGCTNARRVGGANDLGADVVATAPDGRRIVIQCKRYGPTTKVGSQDVQRFGGTCYAVHGAHVAVVVTTSVFTKPAAEYARHQRIRCFDEMALAAWATRTGPAPWH